MLSPGARYLRLSHELHVGVFKVGDGVVEQTGLYAPVEDVFAPVISREPVNLAGPEVDRPTSISSSTIWTPDWALPMISTPSGLIRSGLR